jgi:lysozyme
MIVLDCSHYQPYLDVTAFKAAGVIGVIHKATQYTAKEPVDPYYEQHKRECLDAGLLWGSYCFGDPGDGKTQADFYLDKVKPDGKTLLVLDLESGMDLRGAEDFVQHIRERTGVWPWLYSANYVINRIGGHNSSILANCELWVAGFGPVIPLPWTTYRLWQDGTLNFAGETFDSDRINGSLEDFEKAWKMASPDLTGTQQAALVATQDIAAFKTAGGELHSWHKPGEVFTVIPSSLQTVNGIDYYMEAPDDFWLMSHNIPSVVGSPLPPPPPPPVSKQMVTTSALNMRQQASISSPVLVLIPINTTVTVTGTPSTAQFHYVSATVVVSGRTFSGFVSADFLKNL